MKNQGNVGTSNNKKKKNKKISLTALIFFLIFTVIISCVILLFVHPTFNLKDIQIEGTERYNLDDILSATNLKLNENMFLQTLGKEEIDLSKLPFVKDFSYEYKLPDKIIIRIKERTPLYIAYNKDVNKYFSIDEDGYILDEAKAERSSKEQVFVYKL